MRQTLRRSCDACVRSKLSCDLRTPNCSRCIKKQTICAYANQPLTATPTEEAMAPRSQPPINVPDTATGNRSIILDLFNDLSFQAFDPFDSYPQTRLPRVRVQRLIQHCKLFLMTQYYPLDISRESNPFVVSWWPLALEDPALFHVSLQTASLDVDLRENRNFINSDILMTDSVSLVRQRIENPVLACQDETLNSVVTLAAIEFGKGNTSISTLHIEGAKRMINLRGGIQQVKLTNPLTARMVAWVSMILIQEPQFPIQSDEGSGEGLPPIPQWSTAIRTQKKCLDPSFDDLSLDQSIADTFFSVRYLFHRSQSMALSTTDLHDLTCFVLHRLLSRPSDLPIHHPGLSPTTSESVRCAPALYMLIIHGPTYFSHGRLQHKLMSQLKSSLQSSSESLQIKHISLYLWLLSVGMVSASSTPDFEWFCCRARIAIGKFTSYAWEDILPHLKEILWFEKPQTEYLFKHSWGKAYTCAAK